MRVWAQSSQRSTWPPSAAVRQTSIAVMTRRWARLRCAVLTARQAAPWLRKISATSSFGRDIAGASVRRCRCQVQVFERALDLPDQVDSSAGIAHGSLDVPMSEQVLDDANVDTLFEQMGRKTVSQRVDGDRFAQAGGFGGAPAGQLQRARTVGRWSVRRGVGICAAISGRRKVVP